jgi:hypothetical protein
MYAKTCTWGELGHQHAEGKDSKSSITSNTMQFKVGVKIQHMESLQEFLSRRREFLKYSS